METPLEERVAGAGLRAGSGKGCGGLGPSGTLRPLALTMQIPEPSPLETPAASPAPPRVAQGRTVHRPRSGETPAPSQKGFRRLAVRTARGEARSRDACQVGGHLGAEPGQGAGRGGSGGTGTASAPAPRRSRLGLQTEDGPGQAAAPRPRPCAVGTSARPAPDASRLARVWLHQEPLVLSCSFVAENGENPGKKRK